MEGKTDIIQCDGLTFERTEDMSVLSDFHCGIYDMDSFIHNHLQDAVSREGLETYIVKCQDEVVAVLSICDNVLKTKIKTGEMIEYETEEIEYLAVRKDRQGIGLGRAIIGWVVDRFIGKKNMLSVSAYIDIDTNYSAEPFYHKCGFFRLGKPAHALADHVRMARFL